jgi:predicted DsbA family dithiol-disulfide isomerase
MPDNPAIRISVWSDYVCPFCYLELPVLDRLRAEREGLTTDWRAFELRPEPVPTLDPDGAYLHRVWRQSVYPMADQRGLALRLPPVQPRSRKALEAAEAAREAGLFEPMHRGLFHAFFVDGRDIGSTEVLVDVGRSAGLAEDALRQALASGRHTAKVLADRALAQEIGVSGVPALVIQGRGGAALLSGAQPYEAVRAALDEAVAADRGAG